MINLTEQAKEALSIAIEEAAWNEFYNDDAFDDLVAWGDTTEVVRNRYRAKVKKLITAGFHAAHQLKTEQEGLLRTALYPFVSPVRTSRSMVAGSSTKPELDEMTITVTAGDWFRACIAMDHMSPEYLRLLPANARPSEEFIESLRSPDISETAKRQW